MKVDIYRDPSNSKTCTVPYLTKAMLGI